MQTLQELLDQEAQLSNAGEHLSTKRLIILEQIRDRRAGDTPPVCYGDDDCSTLFLLVCPWRIDCGT